MLRMLCGDLQRHACRFRMPTPPASTACTTAPHTFVCGMGAFSQNALEGTSIRLGDAQRLHVRSAGRAGHRGRLGDGPEQEGPAGRLGVQPAVEAATSSRFGVRTRL